MTAPTGEASSLEVRLQRLEDRFALSDLLASYCAAVDERDLDRLAELFTPDGTFRHSSGGFAVRGRAEIRKFYRDRLASAGPSLHYPHTQIVTFTGRDRATGTVAAEAEVGREGRCIVNAVRYQDLYARQGEAWLFEERVVQFWYSMDLEQLATSYSDDLRKAWPVPTRADLPESLDTWKAYRAEVDDARSP